MTGDRSVVDRRRIYCDSHDNQTSIASKSAEDDSGDDDDKDEPKHDSNGAVIRVIAGCRSGSGTSASHCAPRCLSQIRRWDHEISHGPVCISGTDISVHNASHWFLC